MYHYVDVHSILTTRPAYVVKPVVCLPTLRQRLPHGSAYFMAAPTSWQRLPHGSAGYNYTNVC